MLVSRDNRDSSFDELATGRPLLASQFAQIRERCFHAISALSSPTRTRFDTSASGRLQPRDRTKPAWLLFADSGNPPPAIARMRKVANAITPLEASGR